MKFFHVLLAASLVANLALCGIVAFKRMNAAETLRNDGAANGVVAAASARLDSAKTSDGDVSRPHTARDRSPIWEQLRTDDAVELARRLRVAGFPRVLIVAIVTGVVDDRMRGKFKELSPERLADRPYWKAEPYAADEPKRAEATVKLIREREETLKRALGDGYQFASESYVDMTRRRFGDLPVEKLQVLTAIQMDYVELQQKIIAEAQKAEGGLAKMDQSKFRLLDAERRADIVKTLTPAELVKFDLRNSPSAGRLREDTALLGLSEAEFRALFPTYQTATEYLETLNLSSPTEQQTALKKSIEEMQLKVKELLGAERFADYMQAKDPASKKLNLIVKRLDLPLSAARAVVAVQDDVTQRADAIRTDKALTAEQRAAQLSALSEEAKSKITGSLGERGYAAYLENSGKWLRGLR